MDNSKYFAEYGKSVAVPRTYFFQGLKADLVYAPFGPLFSMILATLQSFGPNLLPVRNRIEKKSSHSNAVMQRREEETDAALGSIFALRYGPPEVKIDFGEAKARRISRGRKAS